MTEHVEFKTGADGSIDTAHYTARGRELRSAAFLAALGKLRRPFAGRAQDEAPAPVRPDRRGPVCHPGE